MPPTLADREHGSTLVLFDVDGTLAVPAQRADDAAVEMLGALRERYAVGIVGAGDFEKQTMQLHGDLHARLDFVFSENGVHAFRGGECLHCKSIVEHLGEARWAKFEATLERLLRDARDEASALLRRAVGADGAAADVGGRGTFLERRQCTVNICPIGRTPTLSKAERGAFDAADREAGLRKRLVAALNEEFGPATEFALTFSIGGQIGIDCCPVGWDKTFCLRFVPEGEFPTVHFFGDKTEPGGGDHEIFVHPRTVGHAVASPADTVAQVASIFGLATASA